MRGELLGRRVEARVEALGPGGARLSARPERGPPTELFLGAAEVPADARVGDLLEVFVHARAGAELEATTRFPRLFEGEVAFLEVVGLAPFGAFVDWGLEKDLLVPERELTREVRIGERHPFGLFEDGRGRLTGTMRIREMLYEGGDFEPGEWVGGEAWRDEPEVGLFAILERRFLGLVPASEPHDLAPGDEASFRIARVHPDGRLELSLRGEAHEEVERDAERVLAALAGPGAPRVGDRSSPEAIRAAFGLSKKAFKRAAGRLLREGRAELDRDGLLALPEQAAAQKAKRRDGRGGSRPT